MNDVDKFLTQAYIKRIAEVNDTLHVVAELNPDAVNIARHLDVERRHGKIRGFVTPNQTSTFFSTIY